MHITAIFFDLGNVLFEVHHQALYEGVASESELEPHSVRDLLRSSDLVSRFRLGKIEARSFFSGLKRELCFHGPEERLASLWCAIIRPIPENFACVYKLHPLYRLGVVSNTNEAHCRYLEANFEVLDCFETRIYSHLAGLEKPSPEIYHLALRSLGVLAEESLFIDDKEENVATAEALGFQVLHLTDPSSLPVQLKQILQKSDVPPANLT
jgi:putative hydrolase of the HAD superfamily